MSTLLKPTTCMIDASNLDRAYEHNLTIELQDWVEDLGFLLSLCIHVSYGTFRHLLHWVMLGACLMLMIGAKVLISLRELSILF